jgi:hypothetical protein
MLVGKLDKDALAVSVAPETFDPRISSSHGLLFNLTLDDLSAKLAQDDHDRLGSTKPGVATRVGSLMKWLIGTPSTWMSPLSYAVTSIVRLSPLLRAVGSSFMRSWVRSSDAGIVIVYYAIDSFESMIW